MVVSLAPVFLSKIFCLESGALLDNLQDIYIYIYHKSIYNMQLLHIISKKIHPQMSKKISILQFMVS